MKTFITCIAMASVLTACGGGGGGSTDNPAPVVTSPFAKYEGEWKDACQFHHRETSSFAVTNSATTIAISNKIEYFDNEDCTGAIVATGVYSQPIARVNYSSTDTNASVKLQNGETVTGVVDRGTAVGTDANVTFTGSGVTSSVVNGKTIFKISYTGGSTEIRIDSISGASPGGLMLRNGQLYILSANGSSYSASAALSR
ncbi:hypothetical protein HSX11_13630 [Oxalobacteraceae bacterium]|nr:hypothetical protein [Oxalobacteraceae bacterium]